MVCFTKELLKREVWDDWRESLKRALKVAHHVNLFWLWVQVSSFIYKNTIELWVMETGKSQNVFLISITHNSKIRELSDGNRVMKTELWKQSYYLPNNLFAMGPTIFELWVMETENWVMEFVNPNTPLDSLCFRC